MSQVFKFRMEPTGLEALAGVLDGNVEMSAPKTRSTVDPRQSFVPSIDY
jgi:hypothetical protein